MPSTFRSQDKKKYICHHCRLYDVVKPAGQRDWACKYHVYVDYQFVKLSIHIFLVLTSR
jgi:hypothetical protein